MPDVVAVEQHGVRAMRVEPLSTRLAIVDLPEPERPVNHSTHGLLVLEPRAVDLGDVQRLQVDIGGAAQAEMRSCRRATVALVQRSIRMKAPVARLPA